MLINAVWLLPAFCVAYFLGLLVGLWIMHRHMTGKLCQAVRHANETNAADVQAFYIKGFDAGVISNALISRTFKDLLDTARLMTHASAEDNRILAGNLAHYVWVLDHEGVHVDSYEEPDSYGKPGPGESLASKYVAPKLGWFWVCGNCGQTSTIIARQVGYQLPTHVRCDNCLLGFECEPTSVSGEEERRTAMDDSYVPLNRGELPERLAEYQEKRANTDRIIADVIERRKADTAAKQAAEKRKFRGNQTIRMRGDERLVCDVVPWAICKESTGRTVAAWRCCECEQIQFTDAMPKKNAAVGVMCPCGCAAELRGTMFIKEGIE